ncbi:calcium activated cation channel [Mrakia frigida]|uniref:calcium activated cation channel n=1 Tax=Mrakia frigida TaxID=29902 RepID=UPI003FCC0EC0
MEDIEDADLTSLLSNWSIMPEPDTATKIIKRVRAMILKLLPVQVDLELISDPTSAIISPAVIKAFAQAGGDFTNAMPFCLLAARASFIRDARLFPPDYDENLCRAMAAEVLARRIVQALPAERLASVMSTRFRYREVDGDSSPPTSALETAIDQNALIFLSSTEAQHVVDSLWDGSWVQANNENDDIDYVEYDKHRFHTFSEHLNPSRLGVPRYQNMFRQVTWIIFLGLYSQAVASPLYKLEANHSFDGWEWAMYIIALSNMLEELVKLFKTIGLASNLYQAIGFWTIVNIMTDSLLTSAFVLRVIGIATSSDEATARYRLLSFQTLSLAAPLLWIKVITVFEGIKVVGTMQVIVSRMIRESLVFFILLGIMAVGFIQSMLALDAADGEVQDFWLIFNMLIQALLGSPDFDSPRTKFGPPFGMIIYYAWSFMALIILLNILIALFNTAYSDIYEDATNQYLAAYSFKTISMIRAPDSFVYPAPFNILEFFFIAPWEFVLSRKAYTKLNVWVMSFVFCVPIAAIALFEAHLAPSQRFKDFFPENNPEVDGDSAVENPEVEDESDGHKISTVSFAELTSVFPDTTLGSQAAIVAEISKLSNQLNAIQKELGLKSRETGKREQAQEDHENGDGK